MTRQQSFTKMENELLPKFRKMTNEAESTEDVKKFFAYSMQELFSQVFSGQLELQYGDIELLPGEEPPYRFSEAIKSLEDFTQVWGNSDLAHIVLRFAELAMNRHRHLAKNPKKTEAKIRL